MTLATPAADSACPMFNFTDPIGTSPVREGPDAPQDDDAAEDGVRPGEGLGLADHVADARGGGHDLRADQRPPAVGERQAHTDEEIGEERGKPKRFL